MDGTRTFKLLREAARRLSIWDAQQREADENVRTGVRLLAEAGEELARFRRLDELQGMLLEVTALMGARIDTSEIEAKVAQALRVAEPVATPRTRDVRAPMDDEHTDDLLRQAAERLSRWRASLGTDDAAATVNAGAHLLAEAEPALSRFRELAKLHQLLTEVTKMIEARVDARQTEVSVERALAMVVGIGEEIGEALGREGADEGSQRERLATSVSLEPPT